MSRAAVNPGFWSGRRVLVTGHTGFKGAWLSLWLERMGAQVTGLALDPESPEGAYCALGPWDRLDDRRVDLRNAAAVRAAVVDASPEVVFHLGAQALVRRSYREPALTYDTNVTGTANLLAACDAIDGLRAVVVVTSDKVYADTSRPCVESDRLGGHDPYAASKACTELLVSSWRASYPRPQSLVTARAGNVIGGGDKAQDRLVPDVLSALRDGRPVELRNPSALRPWQFVLEPLMGYLLYAERLCSEAVGLPTALNFGPVEDAPVPVSEVVEEMLRLKGAGSWYTSEKTHPAEAPTLRLDASQARRSLGWVPRSSLQQALAWTLQWDEAQARGGPMRELANGQISSFLALENT